MDSAEPGDVNVEYMYTRVMNEIGKAIDDGDIERLSEDCTGLIDFARRA